MHKTPCYKMANFSAKDSGLPLDIWLDSIGCKYKSPRIKIGKKNGILISVCIKPTRLLGNNRFYKDTDINEVLEFIERNQNILLKHWNKELTDLQALIELQKSIRNKE